MTSKKKMMLVKHRARDVQSEVEIIDERLISRAPGRLVTEDDIPQLADLGQKMQRAMSGEHGKFSGPYPNAYAIAHHQIEANHLRAFFVRRDIAYAYFDGETVIINPSWEPIGDETTEIREGCMTHGGRGDRKTRRWAHISARFYIPVDGKLKKLEMSVSGLGARIFQHETDHTNGITIYSDKL